MCYIFIGNDSGHPSSNLTAAVQTEPQLSVMDGLPLYVFSYQLQMKKYLLQSRLQFTLD